MAAISGKISVRSPRPLPSVSIAMATYNGERFISAQLESIAAQTVTPSELVIVDDRSNDKTMEIVKSFARGARFPIRLKKNERHRGYATSFMSAANECGSDIISFCDQDDVWDSRKLELCLAPFADEAVRLVYHNALVVDEGLRAIGDLSYLACKYATLGELELGPVRFPKGFTTLFRRDLMRLAPHWANSFNFHIIGSPESHDQFIPFLANAFGRVAYRHELLAKYRRHANNAGGEVKWKLSTIDRAIRAASRDLKGWSNMAATFTRRAEILDKIANAGPEGFSAASATRASAYYRAYARLYSERAEIYQGSRFVQRMRTFKTLAYKGGYGGNVWSKGLNSAAKDFLRGVLRI